MRANLLSLQHFRTPMERGQLLLLGVLALLTVLTWVWSIHEARTMDMPMGVVVRGAPDALHTPATAGDMDANSDMAMEEMAPSQMSEMAATGMASMGGTWDGFLVFFLVWAVMMMAMMFPAAAPMLLLFQRVATQRTGPRQAAVPVWLFGAGYIAVWIAIGAIVWVLIQLTSDLAGRVGHAERTTWAPLALGTVLIVAGLYQFTPLKTACLRHCQSPLNFVMTHWRSGRRGAFRMGVVHGAYCVGCCWALFAVLVAAGVMSMAWMLLLTLVVFAEKVLSSGPRMAQLTGVALLILGVLVASGTTGLPWSA